MVQHFAIRRQLKTGKSSNFRIILSSKSRKMTSQKSADLFEVSSHRVFAIDEIVEKWQRCLSKLDLGD